MGKRGWILAVILAGLMVVGIGGGVILAHGGGKGGGGIGKAVAEGGSLAERVAEILELDESDVTDAFTEAKENWDEEGSIIADAAEILGVEESALEDALAQARREMANEAVRTKMEAMVEKELITQEEADEYVEWFEGRPAFLEQGGWMKGARMGRGDSENGRRGGEHRGKKGGWKNWGGEGTSESADEESKKGYTES